MVGAGGEGPKHWFKQIICLAQVTRWHCIMLCGYMQDLQGTKNQFYNGEGRSLSKQCCKSVETLTFTF